MASRSSDRCWSQPPALSPRQPEVPTEQQHIHYSAAFQPPSITRLLSQSHPGAFESGMTRLPFLQPPRLVLGFLKPGTPIRGEQLSSHNKPKPSALQGTRSFSSSSRLFCSTGSHHLLQHLLHATPATYLQIHVGSFQLSMSPTLSCSSLHLHSRSLICSVF